MYSDDFEGEEVRVLDRKQPPTCHHSTVLLVKSVFLKCLKQLCWPYHRSLRRTLLQHQQLQVLCRQKHPPGPLVTTLSWMRSSLRMSQPLQSVKLLSLFLTNKMQQEQHSSTVKQPVRSPALWRLQQKKAPPQSPALLPAKPNQSSCWKQGSSLWIMLLLAMQSKVAPAYQAAQHVPAPPQQLQEAARGAACMPVQPRAKLPVMMD